MSERLAVVRVQIATAFPKLSQHIGEGTVSYWLGSGISTGLTPRLSEAIATVLTFLHSKIKTFDPSDEHFEALHDLLQEYLPTEFDRFEKAPQAWSPVDTSPAVDRYSELFNTQVGSRSIDYLLVEGLDIVNTYGGPHLSPGDEHHLIALLVLEGVLPNLVTANWDALLEKAVDELAHGVSPLSVRMTNESFQNPETGSQLYKIHGCARLAAEDPRNLEYLVVRQEQIDGWRAEDRVSRLVAKTQELAVEKRTMLVGLSVQDPNIRAVFASSKDRLSWDWVPGDQACVVVGSRLGPSQKSLLALEYPTAYRTNAKQIFAGSLIAHRGAPVNAVLFTEILLNKLLALLDSHPKRAELSTGIATLSEAVLDWAEIYPERVLAWAVAWSAMAALHSGMDIPPGKYRPLTRKRVAEIAAEHTDDHRDEAAFAATLSVIGNGVERARWSVNFPDSVDTALRGALTVEFAGRRVRILLVDERGTSVDRAKQSNLWTSPSVPTFLVHTGGSARATSPRSARSAPSSGRRPGIKGSEVWMSDAWADSDPADKFLTRLGA